MDSRTERGHWIKPHSGYAALAPANTTRLAVGGAVRARVRTQTMEWDRPF
eukprot:gene3552-55293_t